MHVRGTPSTVGLGLTSQWFGPIKFQNPLSSPLVEDGASLTLTNFQALIYEWRPQSIHSWRFSSHADTHRSGLNLLAE